MKKHNDIPGLAALMDAAPVPTCLRLAEAHAQGYVTSKEYAAASTPPLGSTAARVRLAQFFSAGIIERVEVLEGKARMWAYRAKGKKP